MLRNSDKSSAACCPKKQTEELPFLRILRQVEGQVLPRLALLELVSGVLGEAHRLSCSGGQVLHRL